MLKCVVLFSLVILIVSQICHAAGPADVFEARVFRDAAGKPLPYRLLRPQGYDAAKSYPLLLFFHGAAERGNDNVRQLAKGVTVFAREENRKNFQCFVVVPQCAAGSQWVDAPISADAHVQSEKPAEPMRLSMELLAALEKEFNVDSKRIYVAGVAMGGFGVWDTITRYPDVFAAAIPVCGGADESKAPLVANFPIWAFHGDQDTVVKPIRSRHMIDAIKKAGGEPKYTEYPSVGHDSWTKAFNEPGLMEWLFAQEKTVVHHRAAFKASKSKWGRRIEGQHHSFLRR
jgi:predicted peptidase